MPTSVWCDLYLLGSSQREGGGSFQQLWEDSGLGTLHGVTCPAFKHQKIQWFWIWGVAIIMLLRWLPGFKESWSTRRWTGSECHCGYTGGGGGGGGFVAKVSDLSHLDQVSKGASRGNHRNPKSTNVHFCRYIRGGGKGEAYVSVVCVQKERFIQVSKVDEEERKRREQQKLEREQVWGPKLWMCLCWRVSSCWCDCVSALSRRSWMMLWVSPESSTPFPSLWVHLLSTGTLVCGFFFLCFFFF